MKKRLVIELEIAGLITIDVPCTEDTTNGELLQVGMDNLCKEKLNGIFIQYDENYASLETAIIIEK